MAIYKFVKAILKGDEITVFGDGTQTRDFTYIDDVVEATILAAENDLVGEMFNVGGGSRISVNELIGIMERITGRRAKVKYIEKQKGDVRDTLADTSKAKELLGWNPKVNVDEGLKKYIKWYSKEVLHE
ncbi:MAG: GDP-mannose 4,6-dehydratase [archaeon]|nr:GDP-mannose 4,6-dehydratase [archaeon]